MAKSRKDSKGRVLRKGETQRSRDGKYVYTYTTSEGKRRSIYSNDILELRRREDKLIKDRLEGLDVYAAGNLTLNCVFDRYMATKSEIRGTTRRNYTYMYDRFIREGFGKKKIASIRYSDVLQLYQYLLKEKKIQVNTLLIIHTALHPTFQLAVRDNIIRANPSDGVMAQIKKQPGRKQKTRHALTVEQQRAFIAYIEESHRYYHWLSLMVFLLGTGCRIGEALGIRWVDVDFTGRMININHSLAYYCKNYDEQTLCTFSISLPKTEAGIRNIPMIDVVYDILREELEYQKAKGFNDTEIDGMKGFIFTNHFGHVHSPQAVNRAIRVIYESYNADEIVKAAKEHREPMLIPHFSCHHLRHTFCARLCEVETNLKVIQSIMGHASIKTTMDVYAEITDIKKQETMNKLAHTLNVF
ncbi:MAG: site-specific integrase [Lachnospiraceae bacterium]|nr:site-specific integrase [Lachnospiraceae bacterium]